MRGKKGMAQFVVLAVAIIAIWYFASHPQYFSGAQTGSFSGPQQSSTAPGIIDCQFSTIGGTAPNTASGNVTVRADPYDTTHYYIDLNNATNAGSGIISGTLSCERSGDITNAYSDTCQIRSGVFTNQGSSTDAAKYYMIALSSGASRINGIPSGFAETAYLKNGAVATTSDNAEQTNIVFYGGSSAQSQQTLGFYFKLPTATWINYLNTQNSVDNIITCAKSGEVARFTITKIGA